MNHPSLNSVTPMTASTRRNSPQSAVAGFSLIELMIAVLLGILLSIGLVTLFSATSKTNRAQDAMAQLQENGRYAMGRLNADLRMIGHQTLNISGFVPSSFDATTTPNGVVNPTIAADVYVNSITFPDFNLSPGVTALSAPATASGWSANWPANTHWPLSQRYFIQGYECSSGTCSPALPSGTTNDLPAAGAQTGSAAVGQRVKTGDVLTLRYMNAPGWSLSRNELIGATATGPCTGLGSAGTPLSTLTLTPAGTSAASNFQSGDLAMLVTGSSAAIFQVNVSGTAPTAILTLTNLIAGTSIYCPGTDALLYNFSRDLLTVTYYLKLVADPNDSTRVIPELMRRQSTIAIAASAAPAAGVDQELVQGVEQLDFLYSIERMKPLPPLTPPTTPRDSAVSYVTGDHVTTQSSFATCPPEPAQFSQLPLGTAEPDCMWRAIRSIEAHILVDSVHNIYDLTEADMAYQYAPDPANPGYNGADIKQTPAAPAGTPTSNLNFGLKSGAMLRREFVSLISVRNYNP